jgi:hypothetical protein
MMNFAFLRPAMACVMMVGLAACGGSSTVDTPVTVNPAVIPEPSEPTIADASTSGQRASATDLLTTWAPTNPPTYTALGMIPTTGGADYEGYVFGELSNSSDDITDSVIGSLTLEATFSGGGAGFTGNARDFVDSDDADLDGRLTVSGGALYRDGSPASDATVRGVNVAGTLTDDANRALVFGFGLEGDFLGGAYNAIGGEALGRVTVDGVNQNFDGGFIAEQ